MPKVSVIIPVYNVEKYLDECVQSIRKQTLVDIEIILVDDESSDNCPKMCDDYADMDCRIKVVHKKNGGLGFARNSGLDVATGEYVAFTDSDDYELIDTYDTLYKLAVSSHSDIVYYQFISNAASEPSISVFENEDIRKLMLDMVANTPEKHSERDIQVSSCLGLYRRSLIEDNSIRFHSERDLISEDLVFNLDILKCSAKAIVTKFQFYFYRINLNSLTHTPRSDRHIRNKYFYKYLINWLDQNGFENNGRIRAMRLLIGYSRSTIKQIYNSGLLCEERNRRLIEICSDYIWQSIKIEYPIQQMFIMHRLFFNCMIHQKYWLLYLMSKI